MRRNILVCILLIFLEYSLQLKTYRGKIHINKAYLKNIKHLPDQIFLYVCCYFPSQRVKTYWGKYTQVEQNYCRSIHDTDSHHKFDYSYCVKWFKMILQFIERKYGIHLSCR